MQAGDRARPLHVLILVEAGEDERLAAGRRIDVLLQALRADLFHHALHGRVDAGDRCHITFHVRSKYAVAGCLDSRHHAIRPNRNHAVHFGERNQRASQLS
jgi:hypothetical protein